MRTYRPTTLILTGLLARLASAQNPDWTFDYVIVGAGPGGLTLANRLTEDPSVSVAVVEAGTYPDPIVGNSSSVPGYDFRFLQSPPTGDIAQVEWNFTTTPQAGINGLSFGYTRAKVVGGCSVINFMAYSHSSRGALQRWADVVDDQSYTYDNVVQYYQKSMDFTPPNMETRWANATPLYNPADTVTGGPLGVSYSSFAQSWSTWVADALEFIGIPKIDALISGNLNGSSWQLSAIDGKTGLRASAETSYLRPILSRPNLAVFNGTLAERIMFDNKVATGVIVTTDNTTYTLNATREVIVSGGVFQSPQLLQVSGVGPAALLQEYGIPVVADLPGVGQGMNDHLYVGISHQVDLVTSSSLGVGDNFQVAIDAFNANATGPLASPGGDYAALEKLPQSLRSDFSSSTLQALAQFPDDWPEVEYLVLPTFSGGSNDPNTPQVEAGANYATAIAALVAPASRGNVSIASPRMSDQPLINPNWLTDPTDLEVAVAGFKRLREMFAAPVMANVTIGDEFYPGSSVQTDAEIIDFLKKSFGVLYHASSTCKMGMADDEFAVVDSHAKVFGVENLRVVDNSAIPFLLPGPSAQSTVYMLAEKIADDIKNGF